MVIREIEEKKFVVFALKWKRKRRGMCFRKKGEGKEKGGTKVQKYFFLKRKKTESSPKKLCEKKRL